MLVTRWSLGLGATISPDIGLVVNVRLLAYVKSARLYKTGRPSLET